MPSYQMGLHFCLFVLGPIAQLVANPIADPGVESMITLKFMEIDHAIMSTVLILFRPIQEGLLSVTRECMFTKYWLTA